MTDSVARPRPRWWIAGLVLLIAAGALVWIWWFLQAPSQDRVIRTTSVIVIGGAALFIWALFLSRFSSRVKLVVLLGVPAAGFLFHLTFAITGYTGDLVPIVRSRSSIREELRADVDDIVHNVTEAQGPGDTAVSMQTWRDSPQFLGPNRDATWPDVTLERDMDAHSPRQIWKREVGSAWSGFSVRGRDAITQEQRGGQECVVCYDLLTGAPRWLHATDARFDTSVGGIGPRATPTITDDRVITQGATGILTCLDRDTGALHWSRNIFKENQVEPNAWGVSGSPLVLGSAVIASAGGKVGRSLVAYDLETGALRWSGGDDAAGYASPQVTTLLGVRQIVAFNEQTVAGHDPETGTRLWSFPWYERNPNVAQPWVVGDQVLVSSGYGFGCSLHQIARDDDGSYRAERQWKTLALKAKFSNFVLHDGYVYGFDDGIFACVQVADGTRRWKGGRYGHGQVIRCGNTLIVTGEFGDLYLVEVTPDQHIELAHFPAFDDKMWSTPCFAPPYLLLRTEREAACYEMSLAPRR